MLKFLHALACIAALLTLAAPAAALSPGAVGVVPDRVVITLADGVRPVVTAGGGGIAVDLPALDALARRHGVRSLARLYPWVEGPAKAGAPDPRQVWAVDFEARHGLQAVREAWEALPEVVRAEVVEICPLHPLPDDPYLTSQQWFLRNATPGGASIRAQGGWAESTGDTSVVVAIVDSGVDWQHPDLGGSGPDYARGAIAINWAEYHGSPGVDDDVNGFVDDVRGWDFVTGITDGEPGQDVNVPDNDPSDFEGHGTGCAGCAAAITDNGVGVAGTAWNCKVLPVRVGWLQAGETIGVVRMDFCAQGMMYAAANGARVVNCSWGSTSYLESATNYCLAQGCIVVTSAGNANDQVASYLCGRTDVIAVAATDDGDQKAGFSSYGTWVEVSAPGVDIATTYYDRGTGSHVYALANGTSFAAPITSGALALIWSAHPGWSANLVRDALLNGCDDIDALNPAYTGRLGVGRVNLLRTLGDEYQDVPEEYAALADAVNECTPGDTVRVRGGTVHPVLTMPTKPLTLRGGYAAGYGSRDPLGDPSVLNGTPFQPALTFPPGVTVATIVDGFRCTGGGGTYFANTPYAARYGGGVVVNQASPTLRNLDITGNGVGTAGQLGCGGGIYLRDSDAVLENVQVHDNTGIHGAGVFVFGGAPGFQGCTLGPNTSFVDNLANPPRGGGLHVLDADVQLTACRVTGHDGLEHGGGVYAAGYADSSIVRLQDCEIDQNRARGAGCGVAAAGGELWVTGGTIHDNAPATGATFCEGGGIRAEGTSTFRCTGAAVHHNTAHAGAGVWQQGVAAGEISDCLVHANHADVYGGGILTVDPWVGSIAFCTVAFNTAAAGGAGVVLQQQQDVDFQRNLVAFNSGGASSANGLQVDHYDPAGGGIQGNDVHGNDPADYGGIPDLDGQHGNIDLDPLFCSASPGDDGDFTLHADSPCLAAVSGLDIGAEGQGCAETPVFLAQFAAEATADGGVRLGWRTTPDSEAAEFRLEGRAGERTWQVPYAATAPGIYAAEDRPAGLDDATSCTYSLFYRRGEDDWRLLASREVTPGATPRATRIVSVHPNPFNPRLLVDFAVDRPQRVTVSVYDMAGRRLAVLADRVFAAGAQRAVWDGRDARGREAASGPYVVQLSGESVRQVRKVLLLR